MQVRRNEGDEVLAFALRVQPSPPSPTMRGWRGGRRARNLSSLSRLSLSPLSRSLYLSPPRLPNLRPAGYPRHVSSEPAMQVRRNEGDEVLAFALRVQPSPPSPTLAAYSRHV